MTRDDLYGYYRRYYVPNNATLVVVGDVDAGRRDAAGRRSTSAAIAARRRSPDVRTRTSRSSWASAG